LPLTLEEEEEEIEAIKWKGNIERQYIVTRPCHNSGDYSPASHSGGSGSIPGQIMWYWGRFSPSTSVHLPILIPKTIPYLLISVVKQPN
jgi:hypothetical protein